MSNRRPSLWVAAVVAAAVGLSGCAGGSSKTAATPSASATPSALSTTPASIPVPPPTPAPRAKSPSQARTVGELTSALLELDDLPAGFGLEPADASGDGDPSASSTDRKCAPLVKLTNADVAPGSKGSAKVDFSGGQEGPFVSESIDALGSADTVEALQESVRKAVVACHQLTITIPGQGRSTVTVRQVSAPRFGAHPFAVRMTATSGALAGMEITQVTSGVLDAVVSITFVAAVPEDVDGGTEAAVGKAEEVLAGSKAGA